jgi:hypothetical protein
MAAGQAEEGEAWGAPGSDLSQRHLLDLGKGGGAMLDASSGRDIPKLAGAVCFANVEP